MDPHTAPTDPTLDDPTLDALTGGPVPPSPVEEARQFANPHESGAGPGTTPRPANVASAPSRSLGAFALPTAQEQRDLQRIDALRKVTGELVAAVDTKSATLKALVKELQNSAAGGAEKAVSLGLNLSLIIELTDDLTEVLSAHFPAA